METNHFGIPPFMEIPIFCTSKNPEFWRSLSACLQEPGANVPWCDLQRRLELIITQLSFSGIFAAHCMTQRISLCKWHHPGIIFCEEILFEIRLRGHWTQSCYAIHICFLSQMLRRFYSNITEMCCDFDFNGLEKYRLKAEGFDLLSLRIKLVYFSDLFGGIPHLFAFSDPSHIAQYIPLYTLYILNHP